MVAEISYCVDDIIIKSSLLKNNYDDSCLHDIRISLRKSISLINFFEDLIHDDEKNIIKSNLHKLISPTSRARDYDVVFTNYIYPELEIHSDDEGYYKFKLHSENEINNLQENTARTLSSQEYQKILTEFKYWVYKYDWDRSFTNISMNSLGKYIENKINKEYDSLNYHKKNIINFPNKKLHHYRIRIKQLRYIIELFKFYIKKYKDILIKLKAFQDVLGEINDTYAAKKIVKELGISEHLSTQHQSIKKKISQHRKSNLRLLKNQI
jgi:CHAD domain-containing protein